MSEPMLRFVHITDTHISHEPGYNLPEARYIPATGARAVVAAINNLPFTPDFVLHTGDVIYDPDVQAYELAREIFADCHFPMYYISGNHDHSESLQRVFLRREQIKVPFDYEVEINGVQVVCVDSNGPAKRPAGNVTRLQLEWLNAICRADDDRPLVVAVHHNIAATGSPWWDNFMRMTNGDDFHKALLPARHRLKGVFSGHVHQHVALYQDGILYSHAPSTWYQIHCWPDQDTTLGDRETGPGFNVVTITAAQTFIRRHTFAVTPEHEQMRV